MVVLCIHFFFKFNLTVKTINDTLNILVVYFLHELSKKRLLINYLDFPLNFYC